MCAPSGFVGGRLQVPQNTVTNKTEPGNETEDVIKIKESQAVEFTEESQAMECGDNIGPEVCLIQLNTIITD